MSRASDNQAISIPEPGTATAMDDANSFFFPTSEHSSCYELPSIHSITSPDSDRELSNSELGHSPTGGSFSVNNVNVSCPQGDGGRIFGGGTSSYDSVSDGSSSGSTSTPTTTTSADPQCDLLMFLNVASNSIMRTLEKPRRLAGLKKRKVNHRRFIEKQLHKKHLSYPQFHSKARSVKSKELKQLRVAHPISCTTPSPNTPSVNPAVFNNNFIEYPGPLRQNQDWDSFQNDTIFSGNQLLDPAQFSDPLDSEASFQSDSFELSEEAIDDLMRLCDMVSANNSSDDMLQQPCDFTSLESFAADSNSSNDSLSDLSMFFDSPLGTPNGGDFYGLGSDCPSLNTANSSEISGILDQPNSDILHTSPTSLYDQSNHDYDGLSYHMLDGDGYRKLPACMYDQRTGDDLEKTSERSMQDIMSQSDVQQNISSLSLEDVGLPFLF